MAQPIPPSSATLKKQKRKRSASSLGAASLSSSAAPLPADAINPRSYDQGTLRQLAVAGLSDADTLPSSLVRHFPHRPLPASSSSASFYSSHDHRPLEAGGRSGARASFSSSFSAAAAAAAEDNNDNGGDVEGGGEGEDGEGEEEDAAAALRRRRERRERGAARALRATECHLGALTALMRRCLAGGDVARAKRAFGLLLRARASGGRPVDLRQDQYWALGAEILMREGEEEEARPRPPPASHPSSLSAYLVGELATVDSPGVGTSAAAAAAADGRGGGGGASGRDDKEEEARRWGSAANVGRVRAYYEDLIQLYPYNRLWPRAVSALDFWPAMVGVEVYSAWAEEQLARRARRAEAQKTRDDGDAGVVEEGAPEEEEEDDDDSRMDFYSDDGDEQDQQEDDDDEEEEEEGGRGGGGGGRRGSRRGGLPPRNSKAARLRAEEEAIRLRTLSAVRAVARRMDAVMENPPYSTSHEMLRLRGMVGLYMGDLAVLAAPRTAAEDLEGRAKRAEERRRARHRFRKIISDGGELEEYIVDFVRSGEAADEAASARPLFSSLPIRELY